MPLQTSWTRYEAGRYVPLVALKPDETFPPVFGAEEGNVVIRLALARFRIWVAGSERAMSVGSVAIVNND